MSETVHLRAEYGVQCLKSLVLHFLVYGRIIGVYLVSLQEFKLQYHRSLIHGFTLQGDHKSTSIDKLDKSQFTKLALKSSHDYFLAECSF